MLSDEVLMLCNATIMCLQTGHEAQSSSLPEPAAISYEDIDRVILTMTASAHSTAWDDKLGGATGYGAALLAQWAILEGQT